MQDKELREGQKVSCIISLLPRDEVEESPFGSYVKQRCDNDRIEVWADHGYADAFRSLKGVFFVTEQDVHPMYILHVDPRWDVQWVMNEVWATVMTEEPSPPEGQPPVPEKTEGVSMEDFLNEYFKHARNANKPKKKAKARKRAKSE